MTIFVKNVIYHDYNNNICNIVNIVDFKTSNEDMLVGIVKKLVDSFRGKTGYDSDGVQCSFTKKSYSKDSTSYPRWQEHLLVLNLQELPELLFSQCS